MMKLNNVELSNMEYIYLSCSIRRYRNERESLLSVVSNDRLRESLEKDILELEVLEAKIEKAFHGY